MGIFIAVGYFGKGKFSNFHTSEDELLWQIDEDECLGRENFARTQGELNGTQRNSEELRRTRLNVGNFPKREKMLKNSGERPGVGPTMAVQIA